MFGGWVPAFGWSFVCGVGCRQCVVWAEWMENGARNSTSRVSWLSWVAWLGCLAPCAAAPEMSGSRGRAGWAMSWVPHHPIVDGWMDWMAPSNTATPPGCQPASQSVAPMHRVGPLFPLNPTNLGFAAQLLLPHSTFLFTF